jgi:hypothetical protein
LDILKSKGINVITTIDKGPFIAATEPVRVKFGGKFADLIKKASMVE